MTEHEQWIAVAERLGLKRDYETVARAGSPIEIMHATLHGLACRRCNSAVAWRKRRGWCYYHSVNGWTEAGTSRNPHGTEPLALLAMLDAHEGGE